MDLSFSKLPNETMPLKTGTVRRLSGFIVAPVAWACGGYYNVRDDCNAIRPHAAIRFGFVRCVLCKHGKLLLVAAVTAALGGAFVVAAMREHVRQTVCGAGTCDRSVAAWR